MCTEVCTPVHNARGLIVGVAVVLVTVVTVAASQLGREPPARESRDRWFADGQAAVQAALQMPRPPLRARNVILFVGDGLSISTTTAARILEGQLRGASGEENLLAYETMPHLALSKTYSVNAQVPDSAPTMTAMVTGVKTKDDMISVDQDAVTGDHTTAAGNELTTILERAEDAGLSTGIVTTTALTHATPAATYAHTVHRDWEDDAAMPEAVRKAGFSDIARQLAEFRRGNGIEVALGGGRSSFLSEKTRDPEYPAEKGRRLDGRDLPEEWVRRQPRSSYVWNKAQFDAVDPARTAHLLGLFDRSHMRYEHDRMRDGAGEPSLTEMTAKAIDILSRNPRGFFLMVEGGRIDHAHHGGNAYRALTETIELSNAVRLARARTNPADTLIIVTADHSHTFTIAGSVARGNPILGKVSSLNDDGTPAAYPSLDLLGRPYTTISYANGPGFAGASPQQPEGPKRFPHFPTRFSELTRARRDLTFVDTTDPEYMQDTAVPLGSETHSGEDVAIYASGPAAHLIHGVREQNYIFHVMAYALRFAR